VGCFAEKNRFARNCCHEEDPDLGSAHCILVADLAGE
jgi:hypothetical protein